MNNLFKLLQSDGDHKSPWLSKTLWVNGLTFTASLLVAVTTSAEPAWAVSALAGVNMVLRYLTKEPVK